MIVLTRVSSVTRSAVSGASTGGWVPGRRRANSQEITAARVVLAVTRPSGEPSRRRLTSRRRSTRLASRRADRRSLRRTRPGPLAAHGAYPRKAGWMTAASARSNAFR